MRPPRTGRRTHLEDATVRSVCHRVIDEQDEGSIMTKWDELISRDMTTEWTRIACSGRKFQMASA